MPAADPRLRARTALLLAGGYAALIAVVGFWPERIDVPFETTIEQLLAAFATVETDDRGRQLAMYEMTTWALRRPDLAPVAQRQYQAYRRMVTDGLVAGGIDPDALPALPSLVTAVFDGLTLSWLADPEGTDVDSVLALLARLVTDTVPTRRPVRRRAPTRRTPTT